MGGKVDEMEAAGGKAVAHYDKDQVWHGLPILYRYIFSCVTSPKIHATKGVS